MIEYYLYGGSMKYFAIILLVISMFACTNSVSKVTVLPNLPALSNETSYLDPAYKEAWENLKKGDYKLAMENFQKSTIEDEKLFTGYAYVFLLQKKPKLALDNFNKALKIAPDNLQANIGLGLTYELTEDYKKAFEIYSQLLLKFPENTFIKNKYDDIKKEKTEEYLSKAEEVYDSDPDYIKFLKEALYYSPELIEVKINIADFYEKNGEENSATKYYELILNDHPDNIKILTNLGKLYEKLERIEEAVVIYKKLSEIEPDNISFSNKINDLKVKFFDNNLPPKFKDIFFKSELTKEDLAALIGFYFSKYIDSNDIKVKIITDIEKSYARQEIIKVCALNIMNVRPDHRFSRKIIITRAHFAKVITRLIEYLRKSLYLISLKPKSDTEIIEPNDISPVHKDYKLVKELLNSNIMKLDANDNFNQSSNIVPAKAISSLKRVLNGISFDK